MDTTTTTTTPTSPTSPTSPTAPTTTAAVIDRFNQAFQRHDPELLVGLIAEDCAVEAIGPRPDGERHEGGERCLRLWQDVARDASGDFELESTVVLGERAIIQWRFVARTETGETFRGVNLMRVRDGRIVEGLGYAKH
jgi:ketosteroid isomerase-like protein